MIDKFVFSTMLNLVYWDGTSGHVIQSGKLSDGGAHFHGITWDEADTMYVTGCQDFDYVLYKYQLPTFKPSGVINGELHEPHQIFWHDNWIYVTNTGKNRIEVWDAGHWYSVAWRPSPCDIDHINAIWCNGHDAYVVEHRQKVTGVSVVRICTEDLECKQVLDIGPNVHNVYVEEGHLYNLTSPHNGDPAGIVVTDMLSGEHDRIDKSGWGKVLLRGLARTKDHWYVGMSRWEQDRSKRQNGDAIIAVLDNNFQDEHMIRFEDYGPVCSIRVLGNKDFAHNGVVVDV